MNSGKLAFLCLAICLPVVFSCDDDADDDNGSDNGSNVVIIDEDIIAPTVWDGDSIYIIEAYDFYVMSSLTIQAGTIIKFHPSLGPYMTLGGSGIINALGTDDEPVIFTSYYDDAHGGDNNHDGDDTDPNARDWGGINTNGNSGSTFRYCGFYYGGDLLYNATLTIYGGNTAVEHCSFAHNDGSYDHIGVLDASDAGAGSVISNNVFYDNVRPLTISGAFDIDNTNIFHNPDNSAIVNEFNGIFVDLSEGILSDRQWQETEVAYVIDGYQRYIYSGASLTLGNNVVLKFQESGELWLVEGAGQLINHNGSGVYFTSYKDDTKKGDTNGDGNGTSPNDGDWSGIYDDSMSLPAPHFYTWSNIFYDSY